MKLSKLLLIILLVSTFFSCGEAVEKKGPKQSKAKAPKVEIPKDWKTTQADEFAISYPTDWTADTSGQMGTQLFLFAPQEGPEDQFSENINLMTEKLPSKAIGLDAYMEASEKQIQQYMKDAKILSSQRVNLNGKEFQNVNYTGTQSSLLLQFQQYYTIHNGKAYILTLTCKKDSYANYKDLGSQIMSTFSLP